MPSALNELSDNEFTSLSNLDYRQEIRRVLCTVGSSGTFAFGEDFTTPDPNLEVEGCGKIALPLSSAGAQTLKNAATLAPFGHGMETKVDLEIRRAWQIEAPKVIVSNAFKHVIGEHAVSSARKLGLNASSLGIEASLYKMVM